jgi:hypothetical protein
MKFQQLPIGTRFEFEGREYTKTGPVTASSEQGLRMIPRFAVLRPLDGYVAPPPPLNKRDEAVVLAAFADFHGECARLLAGNAEAEATLEQARLRFLTALEAA